MWNDDQGGEMVEWPLVVALLVLVVIGALLQIEGPLTDLVASIGSAISGVFN